VEARLVGEVVVNQRLLDADSARDRSEARPVEALRRELGGGGLEDAPLRVG
jgi:hypothetical protein